ncbi:MULTISPECIES: TetR/AcrR family transcriptional regulator [unclassified Leifsonia]|uniref:TetR/AcrR family transcriptional regulator n=1 Tax=unclassified Leifsonia TaxID=2663824 RepID=UPI0008A7E03D|nr:MULTISPECIES: TetR/AcrR family transcriptional regulator [unclassified Leifsonia]SEI15129.1 DNA-binding transcriptional regulator, AcrR family [Leifsonia sp. CL154]SFM04132.1 DNA-binding transcriptional regulator, AcrR family [Leifsonia sp. CL147]
MAQRGKRGPYAKGIERRKEILDRTLKVFAERGFSKMSLRAIAAEIDVSHAAILHYFPSLEDLLLEVLRQRDLDSRALSARNEVPTLMEELVTGAQNNVTIPGLMALYTSMLGASVEPTNELAREFFTRRFAEGRNELAAAIEAGRRAGTVPDGPDAHALASLIIGAFDGLQVQSLLDPTQDMGANMELFAPLLGEAPAMWRMAAESPDGETAAETTPAG